mmetsp:Transcript_58265/g.161079  ORF Transcript_58265/g.161079 Transcript_58265/m.161079 type:complete len:256 (-) Transcript_58265:214-981(-)
MEVARQHDAPDQVHDDHVHKEHRRNSSERHAAIHGCHKVRVTGPQPVTQEGHTNVGRQHARPGDEEGTGEVLRLCHSVHELKVHPMARKGIHNVGRLTQDHHDRQAGRHHVSLVAGAAIQGGKVRQGNDDHSEDEEGVDEAECHGLGEAANGKDREHHCSAPHGNRHSKAQGSRPERILQRRPEHEQVGAHAEQLVPVDRSVHGRACMRSQGTPCNFTHGADLRQRAFRRFHYGGLDQQLTRPCHEHGHVQRDRE